MYIIKDKTGRGYTVTLETSIEVMDSFMDDLLHEYEAEDIESFLESAYTGDELNTTTIKVIKL